MNQTLIRIKRYIDTEKGRLKQIQSDIEEVEGDISKGYKNLKQFEKAQAIIQTVSKTTQQELEYHISDLVSSALFSIFDKPYTFKVRFVIKRGKTECELLFERNGEEFEPLTSSGGGVVEVASFALRIALWVLKNPRTRNTIILDEPFKFLSKDLLPKAGLLLKELSEKLKIQFIIVTHLKELTEEGADKVFIVEKRKGISVIKELNSY